MKTFEFLQQHRDEIMALAEKHGVKDVRVFGSVARGEEREDSDIDLLIGLAKDFPTFGFLDFQEGMQELTGRKVDIVFEKGVYWYLKDRIFDEAKSL